MGLHWRPPDNLSLEADQRYLGLVISRRIMNEQHHFGGTDRRMIFALERRSDLGKCSRPIAAIECPVLDGLSQMRDGKRGRTSKIGDSARNFQDPVVGARGQALLLHGTLQ